MIKRLLLSSLVLAVVFSAGCLHSKNNPKPRDPSVTGEVETNFRQRWVDRRAGELVAQGKAENVARTQATDEFHARYEYLGATKK
jgi:hypothetical protein